MPAAWSLAERSMVEAGRACGRCTARQAPPLTEDPVQARSSPAQRDGPCRDCLSEDIRLSELRAALSVADFQHSSRRARPVQAIISSRERSLGAPVGCVWDFRGRSELKGPLGGRAPPWWAFAHILSRNINQGGLSGGIKVCRDFGSQVAAVSTSRRVALGSSTG